MSEWQARRCAAPGIQVVDADLQGVVQVEHQRLVAEASRPSEARRHVERIPAGGGSASGS